MAGFVFFVVLRRSVCLVVTGKVSTVDNQRRRGLMSDNISNICTLYRMEAESINHRFLHCKVTSLVWYHFINRCGISWSLLGSMLDMEDS